MKVRNLPVLVFVDGAIAVIVETVADFFTGADETVSWDIECHDIALADVGSVGCTASCSAFAEEKR